MKNGTDNNDKWNGTETKKFKMTVSFEGKKMTVEVIGETAEQVADYILGNIEIKEAGK